MSIERNRSNSAMARQSTIVLVASRIGKTEHSVQSVQQDTGGVALLSKHRSIAGLVSLPDTCCTEPSIPSSFPPSVGRLVPARFPAQPSPAAATETLRCAAIHHHRHEPETSRLGTLRSLQTDGQRLAKRFAGSAQIPRLRAIVGGRECTHIRLERATQRSWSTRNGH